MNDDYPFKYEWKKLYSRIVKAPDGIEYLVTLKGWYWNTMDWLIEEDDWELETFTRPAWRIARKMEEAGTMSNPGVFKDEFERALADMIYEMTHQIMAREDGHENDNKPPE